MRILKRLALVVMVVIGVPILLAALGTLIPNPFVFGQGNGTLSRQVLVFSNTIHTDLAIPLDAEARAAFGFLQGTGVPIEAPDAQWLLIGWGGRSFYLETPNLSDIKPGPTFRALTLDSAVMHVDVLGELGLPNPAVTDVALSEAGYANLLETVVASFARKDGAVQPIAGYAFGATDKFYEAEGKFNALLGCNTWTSRMLRSAGITTGLWNPVPGSLTASLRLFNGARIDAVSPA